jgi:hypothetical protein
LLRETKDAEIFDKIIKGMKKAADKFIEEKAVNNDMVIIRLA